MNNFKDFNFENAILCDETSYYSSTLAFNNKKETLKKSILNEILNTCRFSKTNEKLTKKEKEIVKNEIVSKKLCVCTSLVFKNNILIKYKVTLNDQNLINFLLNEKCYHETKRHQTKRNKHRGITKSFYKYMMRIDIEDIKKEKIIKQKTYDEYAECDEQLNKFKKLNRLNKKINDINFHKQTKLNSLGWKSCKKRHQWQ